MQWTGWPRVKIEVPDRDGSTPTREVEAIAPFIISASRSTDIPAFHGDWFIERLRQGYARWVNPWNRKSTYVSFVNARAFIFWSKNPAPFIPCLREMDLLGLRYILMFTLNDYEAEGLEPRVPPIADRIRTFRAVSRLAGKGRVAWRWDPLLLSGSIDVGELLDRIGKVGDAVAPFTDRMIISFISIARYPRVERNLQNRGFGDVREFTPGEKLELARGLADLNRRWNLDISTCAGERDLTRYGIGPGHCISRRQLLRELGDDGVLRDFLGAGEPTGRDAPLPPHLKDRGQRRECGCVVSKDIGEYSTCPHLCAYCYANSSAARVGKRSAAWKELAEKGIFGDSISGD